MHESQSKLAKFEAIIIGNGLIANHFRGVPFVNPVCIFASGVSNSKERRIDEFERERALVLRTLKQFPSADLVYFSSTSLNFGVNSHYANHKLNMESLILREKQRCFIYRLPQVVGLVQNSTLVSYLTRAILDGELLKLELNAVRNLLSIEDLVRIVRKLIPISAGLSEANCIASGCNVNVVQIAHEISRLVERIANIEYIDGGTDQSVEISFLRRYIALDDSILDEDYWKTVLYKYVPQILQRQK